MPQRVAQFMPFSCRNKGARLLPPGIPEGKYFIVDFPKDNRGGNDFTITIGDVEKQLININGLRVEMAPNPNKQDKISRSTSVQFEFETRVIAIRLYVNMDSASAFIYGQIDSPIILQPSILVPKKSTLITSYSKKGKGKKILHAYYLGKGHALLDIHLALAQYSEFFTIDTNCWNVKGLGRVAATTAIHSSPKRVLNNVCWTSSDFLFQDIVINPDGNPELQAIHTFLQELKRKLRSWPPKEKIALVTDTEYSMVKDINDRKVPLYKNDLLPDGFDLIYATGDRGTSEWMVNRLIAKCDQFSKAQLQEFLLRNGRERE